MICHRFFKAHISWNCNYTVISIFTLFKIIFRFFKSLIHTLFTSLLLNLPPYFTIIQKICTFCAYSESHKIRQFFYFIAYQLATMFYVLVCLIWHITLNIYEARKPMKYHMNQIYEERFYFISQKISYFESIG